ncbi:unnamed protein product [Gongylonema pulchrum]|uniref:DUF1768 domain-containing protein n=1 Tax=Gongylonema pulchrum TaxID=637853 RepID=A0A183E5Y2_9BILA|nr:unnamed protein product [Gongylonema pulchrum]
MAPGTFSNRVKTCPDFASYFFFLVFSLFFYAFSGYGDFAGLGNFNNFESAAEQQPPPPHVPMDEGATPQPLSGNGRRSGNSNYSLQQEIIWIKQDSAQIRNAVVLLEKEKDNLRQAVRKLKLENARVKQKMKRMQESINGLTGVSAETENLKAGAAEAELDYDDIGRDFILVGGAQDPLSLRFEVSIRDDRAIEHKSAERYYWYKMAEHFGDTDVMAKILDAPSTMKAEEAMKEIKGFDEAKWNEVKLSVWETGQRMKFEQTRWIANLLVYTGKTYIAVASQDKIFGTGWRKNRDEANKPIFWDGENQGGKALMRLRQQIKETHTWSGPYEEQEIEKRFNELKKYVWRRIDPARRLGLMRGRARGGFGRRGGYGGRGYGAPSVGFPQAVRH